MNVLAALYLGHGRCSEAEAFYEKALEIEKSIWGSSHSNVKAAAKTLAELRDKLKEQ